MRLPQLVKLPMLPLEHLPPVRGGTGLEGKRDRPHRLQGGSCPSGLGHLARNLLEKLAAVRDRAGPRRSLQGFLLGLA